MNTAIREITAETKLIKPSGPREALLEKINSFRTDGLTVKQRNDINKKIDQNSAIFVNLSWRKLDISLDQLRQMNKTELTEMALLIYERTRFLGLLQTIFLLGIPVIGWGIMTFSLSTMDHEPGKYLPGNGGVAFWKNMRFFWWYRKISKITGQNFIPNLNLKEE